MINNITTSANCYVIEKDQTMSGRGGQTVGFDWRRTETANLIKPTVAKSRPNPVRSYTRLSIWTVDGFFGWFISGCSSPLSTKIQE